jgi:hypothetical protein
MFFDFSATTTKSRSGRITETTLSKAISFEKLDLLLLPLPLPPPA